MVASAAMKKTLALSVLTALFLVSTPAFARDWFVRAGSEGGDGSQEKPFADPWQPLEKIEPGDKIHVAAGVYTGKLGVGQWVFSLPRIEMLGGYDAAFKTRDPWKNLTALTYKPGKSKPSGVETRISGGSDHSGAVLDGFVIDLQERNQYAGGTSLSEPFLSGAITLEHPGSVVRNCTILNSPHSALSIRQGVTVENNLIVNTIYVGVHVKDGNTLSGNTSKAPAIIRNNTIAFTWDHKSPGQGNERGSAILTNTGNAVIDANLIVNNDNHGVTGYRWDPKELKMTNNVFSRNLYSNFLYSKDNAKQVIDDAEMDSLEEIGLGEYSGNAVVDPKLTFDKTWLDLYSQRTAASPGKVTMDDLNEMRRLMGLPILAKGGSPAMNLAPPYSVKSAMLLWSPKNAAVKAGARTKTLEVKFSAAVAAGPAKSYKPGAIATWVKSPDKVDKQALEMTVAVGSVTNGSGAADLKDTHAARWLIDEAGAEQVVGLYPKGTGIERTLEGATNFRTGEKLTELYTVKGTARALTGYPKAGFVIESIERKETAAPMAAMDRPAGREWFVKAGSQGGDGSKEKPFKDPFQAIEKAGPGDTIKVAGGEYGGKLKIGKWMVEKPFLALLGGYDDAFANRDPWERPTLLFWPADSKSTAAGYTLEVTADAKGFILDGFVFDKKTENNYLANGDLDHGRSDKTPPVWINAPGSVVKNCTFVNASEGAIRTHDSLRIENNIFMNTNSFGINMSPSSPSTSVTVLKNNTFLFIWNTKFGIAETSQGFALQTGGWAKVEIDGNVFAFVDNVGVKIAEVKDIVMTNNVFAQNLYANAYWMPKRSFIDDDNFKSLPDLGLKKSDGNQVMNCGFELDQKWFEAYLGRTAYVPGKVTMDEWNQVREMLGQPVLAKGGKMPEGFAPAYDYRKAAKLFPKNPKCTAGAKRLKL